MALKLSKEQIYALAKTFIQKNNAKRSQEINAIVATSAFKKEVKRLEAAIGKVPEDVRVLIGGVRGRTVLKSAIEDQVLKTREFSSKIKTRHMQEFGVDMEMISNSLVLASIDAKELKDLTDYLEKNFGK